MYKSMTGFAQRDFEISGISGGMTLKSYNNRYLDISVFLPSALTSLEPRIVHSLGEHISRGKIEFSLKLRTGTSAVSLQVDAGLAKAAFDAYTQIAKACGLDEQPSLQAIAAFEGVLVREGDIEIETMWASIEREMDELLNEYEAGRIREGNATKTNIDKELGRFVEGLGKIEGNAAEIETIITVQLEEKFMDLLKNGYDEQRVLQEVAVQLVRLSINEEISRLKAHIAAFYTISAESTPAKKLDFLCQEMNREVNTIGSKNVMVEVSHAVIEMKDALENIREQLKNLE